MGQKVDGRAALSVTDQSISDAPLRHQLIEVALANYPIYIVIYTIALSGRRSAFQAGFRQDSSGKPQKQALRPAEGRPEGRF